ncbi:MFS transporter [Draconibacterium sp. IB214405]|uniref:MFS transporter n=1 Tax=Draconibacterium sp. IB214405 TaxID=3097352 RepID=UPI002A11D18D|nr:MFS transporter [Draconibacterium sp. IB214405]MDX8338269.1 MFS transporter [Draconibacterium sp. IB214405]
MQNKNLLLLWTGKLVSALGDKMYAIAIAWWILEITNSSTMMGLYLLAATLPMVVMGIVAGAVIDKSNLKRVLIIADIVRGVGITLLGLLFLAERLTLFSVFSTTVVVSLASAFFNPAVTSIVPRIVPKSECGKANSLLQLVDGLAKVAGPFAGVAMVVATGYAGAFLINGISFLLSAFFEGFIRYDTRKPVWRKTSDKKQKKTTEIVGDIQAGLQYVFTNTRLINLLFYIFAAHLFVGALSVMLPVMAKFISDDNLNLLGILETALGAGFVAGAFILSRRSEEKFRIDAMPKVFILVGCSIITIGIIAFFSSLPLLLFVLPVFVIGSCIVYASINWKTFMQLNTPPEKLGRVAAISGLVGDITLPIAFALYGFLLDQVDFVILTVVSGMLLILTILFIKLGARKKLAPAGV